jgi:hypothetical protein
MTTIAHEGERHLVDGLELTTYRYQVRAVAGLDSHPDVRGSDIEIPNLPGRRPLPRVDDTRLLAYALWITDTDADGNLAATEPARDAQYRANLELLHARLGIRHRLVTLQRILGDGRTLTATGWSLGLEELEHPVRKELKGATARIQLPDPYFYGTTLTEAALAIAASPTDWAWVHPGTARGHRARFEITGPASNPRITNQTTGYYVEALVTLGAGEKLTIDGEAFTADVDGANAIGAVRHSGGFAWMAIDPGSNAMRLTSGATGGTLTATFEPPYY